MNANTMTEMGKTMIKNAASADFGQLEIRIRESIAQVWCQNFGHF